MTREIIENLVKKVVAEICKKDSSIDKNRPFNILMRDPLLQTDIQSTTCPSLESAVRTLVEWLEREPKCVVEIIVYRPRKKVIHTEGPRG